MTDLKKQSNLTQSQFLIWLGQQIDPNLPLYNMVFTFTFYGELNRAAFQRAFQTLVEQTDALRLVLKEGIPQQFMLDHINYQLEYLDFSIKPEPKAALEIWQTQRAAQPFNLTQCLFDSVLIKLAQNQFVWYLNQHHLITDGWSSTVIYQRMADLYRLAIEDNLNEPPTYPAYQDYIAYERRFRQSPKFEKASNYWRDKLTVPFEPTQFFEKTVANKTAQTQRVSYTLGSEQVKALTALTQRPDVRAINVDLTRFSLFATVLFVLIHRLSGQKQLRLGTPFHNRPTTPFKETVGLFIEVGPLQVEISPEETFLSLAKQVQAEALMGLRYAQPGISSAATNSAYDVLLNYIHANYGDFAGIPMKSEWIHSGYGDRHHNLRLQVHDHDQSGHFVLHFDMNCDVFNPQQREWLVQHFLQILAALLIEPNQSIQDVKLLSDQACIVDFNSTTVDYPKDQTVVSLFEAQVNKTPDAVALVLNEQQVTYRALNQRANQLAHRLQANQLIGLFVERSIEAIVGILGVLKAGSAYVPIDSNSPIERIRFLLTDAQILLTQQKLRPRLPKLNCKIICLDSDWQTMSKINFGLLNGDQIAYVIYTSGSTGQPKGVMISHQGLVHYIRWAKKYYLHDQCLDFPLYSSLAFDLTVTSIFTPLVSGGKLVIYPEEQGLEILTVIQDNAVDIIKLTPAHLNLIKEIPIQSSRIKKLIVGGEDFKTSLAQAIYNHFNGQISIYNEYGPTETVVGCMIHQYDPTHDTLSSVPIGKPIDNIQIYVLDDNLNPTPMGVIGEIYIAGEGVARGYLNQPELTSERFVNNPFTPNTRMYRSGDLARWISHDQLEFLGRADYQVKIKGYRIELGEIEATLLKHPAIDKAIVDVVQHHLPKQPTQIHYCVKCGLPSNYPETSFDEQGVCNTCRDFETHQAKVQPYFRTKEDLQAILAQATKVGKYDCLALLSGGKDSTYMLCQLVELGVTPLVFSLDNGYISESAKANIQRITDSLGVDLVWGSTPHMNTIFTDSLHRFSNVCNGCFKTIYTLSLKLAHEKGIKYIVTGLSRGQLFETRLSDTFNAGLFDVAEIDKMVLDARKVYHRIEDAVSECLDTSLFDNDAIFEEIQFIDYYRYTDVEFNEIYDYLTRKTAWVRPKDTGRSTNCLINELGIYIHKKEQGYHNYALPYSWDVRMGHKTRAEALHELDDEIDEAKVKQMLKEIGYDEPSAQLTEKQLAAYYVSNQPLTITELKTYLAQSLPEYMIPTHFFTLDKIPLTANGKVDREALPQVGEKQSTVNSDYIAPNTPKTIRLANIWAEVFHLEQVGLNDNFFALGGDSIISIQITAKAKQQGLQLEPKQLFEYQTIAELANVATSSTTSFEAEQSITPETNEYSASDFPLAQLDEQAFEQLANVLDQLEGS